MAGLLSNESRRGDCVIDESGSLCFAVLGGSKGPPLFLMSRTVKSGDSEENVGNGDVHSGLIL